MIEPMLIGLGGAVHRVDTPLPKGEGILCSTIQLALTERIQPE